MRTVIINSLKILRFINAICGLLFYVIVYVVPLAHVPSTRIYTGGIDARVAVSTASAGGGEGRDHHQAPSAGAGAGAVAGSGSGAGAGVKTRSVSRRL